MDDLPETFSTGDAHDILKWQGSRLGLTRHLEAAGYVRALRHDAGSRALRHIWRLPPAAVASASVRSSIDDDHWQCGDDELIAKVALQLIERNSIATAEAFFWLESQITTAGPRFCREMLTRFANEEVPF